MLGIDDKKEDSMEVIEIKIRLFIQEDINLLNIQEKIAQMIDKSFLKNNDLKDLHEKNTFKNYCFDLPYPVEKDKIYHKNCIYTIRIRTISLKLAIHFSNVLANEYTNEIKAINAEIKKIPKKHIEKIYSITPVIMKDDRGYWRNNKTLEEFEKGLFINLIKKYKNATGLDINENFQLYKKIEFMNKKPITVKCKNITLLGDKISLLVEDSKEAQMISYLSLGTGMLENNSRGAGFMNFRYL